MSGGVRERGYPAYPLDEVQAAFGAGRFKVTRRVQQHMDRRGWRRETVRACICSVRADDFYKSQSHLTVSGVWLDIYKPLMCGERMYVKFMRLGEGESFTVLSFCCDGEPH